MRSTSTGECKIVKIFTLHYRSSGVNSTTTFIISLLFLVMTPNGGRKGFVHHAVMDDFDSLEFFDIYACGSPVMIDASKKDFMMKNLSVEHFYSDAFTASNNIEDNL